MRKIRVFVDASLQAGSAVMLPPFAAEHLTRVLRLGSGAEVVCFNGDGRDYAGTLQVHSKSVIGVALESVIDVPTESPLSITLAQSVARGEKMDFVLQKATELGATRISPIVTERTEVRLDEDRAERRVAHWLRVVHSACEQCGRARLPVLDAPQSVAQFAAAMRESVALRLALHPDAASGARSLAAPSAIVLAVGPEGGFSERDLDALALGGFSRLSLGPRILRTETAGPAALAALQALFGDLG